MKELIKKIVADAEKMKDTYTDMKNIPAVYACIFCQSDDEYSSFLREAHKLGKVIQERANSFLFKIAPIDTVAGKVELLRVRQPDKDRPERGDADFLVEDHASFREKYIGMPGFSAISRDQFEMIELYKKGENVRVYFSMPELVKQLMELKEIKDTVLE